MKLITTAVIFCLVLPWQIANAQAVFTDGYSGKVKEVIEYNYEDMGSSVLDRKPGNRTRKLYDVLGHKTREYALEQDGSIVSKIVYTYDSDGRLKEERSYNGRGKYLYANLFRYDKHGNEVLQKHYSITGALFLKTSTDYDSRNNPISEESKDADGHLLNRARWSYDAAGNVLKEVIFDGDELETSATSYTYDGGNRLQARATTVYGITLVTKYTYTITGDVADETSFNAEGIRDKRIAYEYDDKGTVITQKNYSADGKLQKTIAYRTIWDDYGNVVRKIQLADGKEIDVERREFVYY